MKPAELKKLVDGLKGLSVVDIAKRLNISRTTFYRMKKANWVEPPPKRNPKGRPRVEDRIKFAARNMIEAASGPLDPETLQKKLGADDTLIAYINSLPMANADQIRKKCTELFGRAVAKGNLMAMDPKTKPAEYVAIMGVVNESMRLIGETTFGASIPESLNVIEGEVTGRVDPRSQQLRELLRG